MACKVIAKVLGYELCIFDREGTLYSSDHVVLIRKAGYTELFNLDTMRHETGDYIKRDVTTVVLEFVGGEMRWQYWQRLWYRIRR